MPIKPKQEITFEQESIEECLNHPDYFDYLRDEDFKKDLTNTEIKINNWLEIQGYWAYTSTKQGSINLHFPHNHLKQKLKTEAFKIMRERYQVTPRLYYYEEISNKKKEIESKRKAYELEKIETERFCPTCGIIKEKCNCEKGLKERNIYE